MMQGDSYGLPIEILNSEKAVVTPDDVSDVEITIGSLRKSYADGEVIFSTEAEKWVVPLTQEETFSLRPGRVRVQLRVKRKNGEVEGFDLGSKNIFESISKEVL